MLMVIFGAGASFDSSQNHLPKPIPRERAGGTIRFQDDYPEVFRPPLTNGLFERSEFEEFSSRIPRLAGVLGQLRSMPLGSLESELLDLDSRAPRNTLRAQQLVAFRYYLQLLLSITVHRWLERIGGATNYLTLTEQIRDYDDGLICLVTFNYDLMVERALGWDVQQIEDYIRQDWRLLKVHGSVNWARPIRTPAINHSSLMHWPMVEQIIDASPSLEFGEGYTIVPFISQYPERLLETPVGKPDHHGDPPLFPAIAIPLPNKLGPECPQLVIDVLRESLPQVTKLLIIGWAGREDHFLRILREGLPAKVSGLVVNGGEASAREAIEHIGSKGIGAQLRPSRHGFTDFLISGELKVIYSSG